MSTNWVGFGQSQVSSTFMDFCWEERCFWFVFYLDAKSLRVTNPSCVFHKYFCSSKSLISKLQSNKSLVIQQYLVKQYLSNPWTIPSHKSNNTHLVLGYSTICTWMQCYPRKHLVGPRVETSTSTSQGHHGQVGPWGHGDPWGHDPYPIALLGFFGRWGQLFADA